MAKTKIFLSKSKFLDAIKCPKLVWFEYNQPKDVPKPDRITQAIFDQGNRVGALAQTMFPNGIKVERDWQPEKMHARSMQIAKLRKPMFEPGFVYGQTYALADILEPVGSDQWDLIEVKSGTSVEDVHVLDVAFQKYVYSNAGLNIRNCYVMHINNQYLRQGDIDPYQLFAKYDITQRLAQHLIDLPKSIEEILEKIKSTEPAVKIGPQCSKPHNCPLHQACWAYLPKDNIFNLRGSKKNLFGLLDQGVYELKDMPLDGLNEKQIIQIKSHVSNQPYIDAPSLKEFLSGFKYPLYFLDFETLASSIPVYNSTHAFEQVPFQFSLHVLDAPKSKPRHYSFLAMSKHDPRPILLEKLKKLLANSGSIVAYNMSFEINCLKQSAKAYPEYLDWFESIQNRFIDLLVPFRGFYYYHPKQAGSASIKEVLPALTGEGYQDLEISDGGTACLEFERVTFADNISDSERQRVYKSLEKYCELDTQAMIDVYRQLINAIN